MSRTIATDLPQRRFHCYYVDCPFAFYAESSFKLHKKSHKRGVFGISVRNPDVEFVVKFENSDGAEPRYDGDEHRYVVVKFENSDGAEPRYDGDEHRYDGAASVSNVAGTRFGGAEPAFASNLEKVEPHLEQTKREDDWERIFFKRENTDDIISTEVDNFLSLSKQTQVDSHAESPASHSRPQCQQSHTMPVGSNAESLVSPSREHCQQTRVTPVYSDAESSPERCQQSQATPVGSYADSPASPSPEGCRISGDAGVLQNSDYHSELESTTRFNHDLELVDECDPVMQSQFDSDEKTCLVVLNQSAVECKEELSELAECGISLHLDLEDQSISHSDSILGGYHENDVDCDTEAANASFSGETLSHAAKAVVSNCNVARSEIVRSDHDAMNDEAACDSLSGLGKENNLRLYQSHDTNNNHRDASRDEKCSPSHRYSVREDKRAQKQNEGSQIRRNKELKLKMPKLRHKVASRKGLHTISSNTAVDSIYIESEPSSSKTRNRTKKVTALLRKRRRSISSVVTEECSREIESTSETQKERKTETQRKRPRSMSSDATEDSSSDSDSTPETLKQEKTTRGERKRRRIISSDDEIEDYSVNDSTKKVVVSQRRKQPAISSDTSVSINSDSVSASDFTPTSHKKKTATSRLKRRESISSDTTGDSDGDITPPSQRSKMKTESRRRKTLQAISLNLKELTKIRSTGKEDVETSKPVKKFKCSDCDKAFSRSSSLKMHARVHTEDRPFKCESCPQAFTQASNLTSHQSVHTDTKPFTCEHCDGRFKRKEYLKQHIAVAHPDKSTSNTKTYKCSFCGKLCINLNKLEIHLRVHTKEKPYKCELCPLAFANKKNLTVHLFVHNKTQSEPNSEDKPLKTKPRHLCCHCDKEFHSPFKLETHLRIHTGDKPFKCELCPYAAAQRQNLKNHVQAIHTKLSGEPSMKLHKCPDCDKVFSHPYKMRRHALTHTGERPFKCELCPLAFTQKVNLKSHQAVHSSEKLFECKMCQSRFALKKGLKSHMDSHKTAKPYKCDKCFASNKTKEGLRRHKVVHEGDKTHKCTMCPATFYTASKLKLHEAIHYGTKKYQCSECPAAFVQLANLKNHAKLHSGERDYKCDRCTASFSQEVKMRLHRNIHFSEVVHVCHLCGITFSQAVKLQYHLGIHGKTAWMYKF